MGWKDKFKGIGKKIEREVKKPIKKIEKEIDRATKKVEKKVEKEIDRVEAKYSPAKAIEGLEQMDTELLKLNIKNIWIRKIKEGVKESTDYSVQWLDGEIRISKSKLDDFLLPLLPSLKKLIRKLGE